MDAHQLWKAGQLQPAIEALGNELRKQPSDSRRRTFLFELLCFAGQYDRAAKQLDVLASASPDAEAGALVYRSALHAQRTREDMFASNQLPQQPEAPSPAGVLNGEPFDSLEDEDPRLGATLEVFIAGSYTWVPFRYIQSLTIEAPTRLRDLLWIPAILETTKEFRFQELGQVLLPALAPLSWQSPDDNIRLGRASIVEEHTTYGPVPLGSKLLLTPQTEHPLLQIRSLTFQPVTAAVET